MKRKFVVGLAFALGGLGAGCGEGDGLPRERVSGKVTLDGQAVESGTIQFMPTVQAADAVGGGAVIEAGAYDIPRAQGLLPGTYRVNVFSPDVPAGAADAANAPPGETKDKPAKERIPARYNAQSTLKAEVTKGGENRFDYDLKSK